MERSFNLGPILAATLTVENIFEAEKNYTSVLGYKLEEEGYVSPELAFSWDAEGMQGRQWKLLRPESNEPGSLRLVQGDIPKNYRPIGHFGWTAVEILIRNPEEMYEKMKKSSFEVIGKPRPLKTSPDIKALQVLGADGEVLYLTNVSKGASPMHILPLVKSNTDRVFIMVLGSSDHEKTIRFYKDQFGLLRVTERVRSRNFFSNLYGLKDEGKELKMSTIQLGGSSLIQVDSMQGSASIAPCKEDMLPPGIAMVSFSVKNIKNFSALSLGPEVMEEDSIYQGSRALTIRGSSGELVELIDIKK